VFKWYATKLLNFIRDARYPSANGVLFEINDDGNLCACALGQVALGLGLVTEKEARIYAEGDDSPVYDQLREFFKNDDDVNVVDMVPPVNDGLYEDDEDSKEFFERVATELESSFREDPSILVQE